MPLSQRTKSYQRLKAKLKRNPSSAVDLDKKSWPRPDNPKELIIHALKGGARAFILSFGLRSGVNLCLYLLRIARGKGKWSQIFAAAFKNPNTIRFASMFGAFAFLWKFVNNGMRLYRGKDDRLNSLVGGAVAGLAILCENPENRVDIAQQLLVRALQGVYNAGKARDIIYFRNGDALLFGICCAQILYAYAMQPHTLSPSYHNFMIKAARVPEDVLALNAKNVRGLAVPVEETLAVVKKYNPTKHALSVVENLSPHPDVMPCEVIHPWIDGCNATAIERFFKVCRHMFPVYGTLHFVPMLLLRTGHLRKAPLSLLSKTAIATLKSCAFLGLFVTIYQYQVCMHRKMIGTGITTYNSKYLYGLFGFVCSYISIFMEDKKRRGELALYCLPIALKSFYQIANQRQWIVPIKHFEVMMASFSMAIIMSFYQEEPDVLSSFVRKIMYHFFGRN